MNTYIHITCYVYIQYIHTYMHIMYTPNTYIHTLTRSAKAAGWWDAFYVYIQYIHTYIHTYYVYIEYIHTYMHIMYTPNTYIQTLTGSAKAAGWWDAFYVYIQ